MLISLHICSMWETICDAWAYWSGWKFGPKFYRIPLFWNTVSEYPSPENENCQGSWHFDFSVSEYPPSSENWNLGRSWHFVTFQFQKPPPSPENWNLGRSWHFVTFQFQNTPPPENWNLGRSWHFVTFQFQNTPPPWKLKFRHILALCDFLVSEYPPTPLKIEI